MNNAGTIIVEDLKELAIITAELVRQGVIFEAHKNATTGDWAITFTGGF